MGARVTVESISRKGFHSGTPRDLVNAARGLESACPERYGPPPGRVVCREEPGVRRFSIAVVAAVTLGTALSSVPAHAGAGSGGRGLAHCTADTCHFDVPPGTYDVRVTVGGKVASSTSVSGETRRSLLPETAAPAGKRVTRSFTVNVRTPEGEPTGPEGTPGLDLRIGGTAVIAMQADSIDGPRSAAPPRPSPASRSSGPGTPARSSWSATPPSATSPAIRTPAGASSCRSTSARASPSPTTPIPGRVRSPIWGTRSCGPPYGP